MDAPKRDVILTTGEKIGGMAVTGVAVGAVGYGAYVALPILKDMAWDATKLIVAGGIVAGTIYVASDPDMRSVFGRAYRLGVRKLRRWVIQWDPIANLELNIAHMRKREGEMVGNRKALQAQITGLEKQIERFKSQMESALNTMQHEQQRGQKVNTDPADIDDENAATQAGNKFGRREASVKRLEAMLITLKTTAKTLKRIHNGVKFLIEDTQDEVEVAKIELAASTAAGNAADNAMDVIRGDARLSQMYREAMQIIDDKVAERMGAVEMAVSDSKGFLNSVDSKNSQYNQSALKALQRWEKNAEYLQLNPGENKVRVATGEDAAEDAREAAEQAAAAQASASNGSAVSRMFRN